MASIKQLIHWSDDVLAGKPAKMRSSQWSKVRDAAIKESPECQVCGNSTKKQLVVHHKKPFHLYPELELEPSNLAVVCEDGPGHLNCHLVVGHTGNFRQYNNNFDKDSAYIREMVRRTGEESL